ncbi:hypothetical protein [Piscinibacter gummiphilus]|uniref:DUF4398 domain-containing protein n=1 Tax=Piscinibacter gummiphilus TaxID=946333 RepID=A0ABZ0CNB9_9BURK|nr:hypothetical protein [Piscinibacter gummiphilus]WOB06487.1 hypothetical protein RXV79_16315 [Piscinibacter gummiphilus]
MKRSFMGIFAMLAMAVGLLAGCALNPGEVKPVQPRTAVLAAYKTADLFVDQLTVAVTRGRITRAEAQDAYQKSLKARNNIVIADNALRECKFTLPCPLYLEKLNLGSEALLQLEADLRAKKDGAAK